MPVADALARVLEGVDAAAGRDRAARRRARPRARRAMSRRCAPSRRPTSPRWTATRCGPTTSRARRRRSKSSAKSPPGIRSTARSKPGEAARIFTGGVVPRGADTVVIQENTTRDGDTRHRQRAGARGTQCARAPGSISRKARCCCEGRRLTDRDLMLAAAMNHPTVPVHRPPESRCSPPATSWCRPAAARAGPDRLFERLRAHRAGARRRRRGHRSRHRAGPARGHRRRHPPRARRGRRYPGDHRRRLGRRARSGAAGAGRRGHRPSFWKVAMRPGKPMMHGRLGGCRCSACRAIRSRPMSAPVLFLVPLIRRLLGRAATSSAARAGDARPRPAGERRARGLPARGARAQARTAAWSRRPLPAQDSSMMAPLAKADCLLIREPYAPAAKAGSPLRHR